MSNELGMYLREQRGDRTLREFAKICNISHTHLDSLEKGKDPRTGKPVSVSTETLRLIAEGLHIDYLFLCCLADGYRPDEVQNVVVPLLSPEMRAAIAQMEKPPKKKGQDQLISAASSLDPELQGAFLEFLELAKEDPETAKKVFAGLLAALRKSPKSSP